MTPKQRLESLARKLEAKCGFVSEDVDICRAALAEIGRLEEIETNAKELYEYRQAAFPGILAAENMQLVLDGLECKLFPERFRHGLPAKSGEGS